MFDNVWWAFESRDRKRGLCAFSDVAGFGDDVNRAGVMKVRSGWSDLVRSVERGSRSMGGVCRAQES